MRKEKGILSIVATPIGNLDDISARAIKALKEADVIAAEDTRHSRKLLSYLNIDTPLWTYHDYSSEAATQNIIQRLLGGDSIALISDAGTPLISDPGYPLVKLAHAHDIPVQPLPGPCALITALSISGLPSDKFTFIGFLPAKPTARKKEIDLMMEVTHTWIFYESPHRIMHALENLCEVLGSERKIVLARELTKHFETILSGTVSELLDRLKNEADQRKGEFVVLVHGKEKKPDSTITTDAIRILSTLLEELPLKQASHLTAKLTGIKKRDLYEYGLTINKKSE